MSLGEELSDDFYTFWKSLGEKPQTTLRCFERGEIMTLHDSDAVLVAKEYYKNISLVRYYSKGKSNFPYISVKKTDSNFLRHFLLKRQYRVEIYASLTKSGRDNEWSLKSKASPGNLSEVEDILLSQSDSVEASGLCAVNFKYIADNLHVYIAFCHKESRRFIVGEILDSIHLANLETALVQLEARECLIPSGINRLTSNISSEMNDANWIEHLSMVFERAGILASEVKKSDFSDTNVFQDLDYLLRRPKIENLNTSAFYSKEFSMKGGLACLGAIIKFLDLKVDDSNAGAFTIETFSLEDCVRLDSAATRALHLLPGPDDRNRYQSVYGVLNNCRTPQGQRLLAQWIRQPLTDPSKIDERLDLVEALVEETGARRSLHEDFLRRVPDLQRLARRLQKRRGTGLQDVFRIYQVVSRLPNAISLLSQCGESKHKVVYDCLIEPLKDAVHNFSKFQEMVESTIDLDSISRRNEFIIRADFDEALTELKRKMDNLEDDIKDEFRRSASKLNLEQGKSIKLDCNDQLGFFMRVTLKEEKCLRDFKTFEIIDAQKGGVRFRNTNMSHLNESYNDVKQEYSEEQQNIVNEVVKVAAGYLDPLTQLNSATAFLDVIVSLAIAAVSTCGSPYVRPKILPPGSHRLILKDARHPCLEMQDAVSVIPNDVHLERGKQIFLVITGPNMGGKSTYIRSVGVIVAMAQIGSFVPCSYAELMPVDAIMARVGAADYQSRGVSTFLAEMLETSAVLRSATTNSLVIIDELGRGTSTYDGFGLAWSVASYLAGPEIGCFSLFATHFHELTSLAYKMPGRVANLRVLASIDTENAMEGENPNDSDSKVVMLYKVEPGVCNRSYGLDVARLADLPVEVIKDAETQAARDEELEELWFKIDEYLANRTGSDSLNCKAALSQSSGAVYVADQLRPKLLQFLGEALASETPDGQVGLNLAKSVTDFLQTNSSDLPTDLLLSLTVNQTT